MASEAANRKVTRVGFDGKDTVIEVRSIASKRGRIPNKMIISIAADN